MVSCFAGIPFPGVSVSSSLHHIHPRCPTDELPAVKRQHDHQPARTLPALSDDTDTVTVTVAVNWSSSH